MRKRAKMRLALLGGMIAGAVAGCWLLDVLEAAANWILVHWMGLDLGRAAARAPAMSGLMLCGLFGIGLYLYCRWDENRQYVRQARRHQQYGKINRNHARMEEPEYWTNRKDA